MAAEFGGRMDIRNTIGERDFIYELLNGLDTGLCPGPRRIDDVADGTETNNELTKMRLANSVACTENISYIVSQEVCTYFTSYKLIVAGR